MAATAEADVAALRVLPSGRSLPGDTWRRRHVGILALLGAHAVGLTAFGIWMKAPLLHALLEGAVVGVLGLVAAFPRLPRRARSIVAAVGLMTSSAVLTHLSGGYIEAHFHFFVMLGVIFLYEDWVPYVLAVAYVAVHHGIAGSIDPLSVFNHPDAIAHPWRWAGIHALFIMGLSAALIVAWNVIEGARRSETRALSEAHELKRQLHSQEKMAALGSLVSGLAHEVRTPLTVVATNTSILEMHARREPDDALARRVLLHAQEIQQSVDRMNALVLQLRRFHGLAQDEMVVVPLEEVVHEAATLFSSVHRGAAIQLDLQPTPPVRVHLLGVHQIVLNLLTNAVDASEGAAGKVTVRTRAEDGRAVLEVEDRGCGMSADVLRHIFDPLFTTKKDGMGLGLHIVSRIVQAHDAEVSCQSSEGRGTTFRVRFRGIAAGDVPGTPTEAVAPRTVAQPSSP